MISTGLSLSCGTWSCHAVSLFTNSVFTVSSGAVFLSVFVLSISPIILPITKAVKKHRHPLTYTSILPIFFSLCQSHKIFLSISIVFFSLISFKSAIAFSSYSCLIHCHSIFYRGPVSSLHHLCIISASFLHYAAVLISIPYMLLSVFPVSCNNPCRIPLSKRAYPAFAAYALCLFLFTAFCCPQESHHCCLSYDLTNFPHFLHLKSNRLFQTIALNFLTILKIVLNLSVISFLVTFLDKPMPYQLSIIYRVNNPIIPNT